MPREALIASLMETKKKLISMESQVSTLKAENQRWENEISKQQKRIDKLLDTSTNRHGTSAADIRKELEKSTIVRQLKRQNHSMKNNLIDKDIELEKIKKSIKGSALMILSTEKDEYYMECLRLKEVVSKLIEENRIYKSKVKQHGKEDDEIRREVVRLSSGFQSLLESAGVSSSVNIPATSHKKGYKNKDKFSASSPLNYFNSEIVTQDDGLQINITNNETVNVPVMSTPTVAHKGDSKSKDIFDITPSTPFPLLSSNNGTNNSTNTPNIVASSLSSSKGSPPSSPVYKYRYQIGEKVQGQYKGGFNWYGATIKAASRNNDEETYHLIYDDGDEEKIVSLSHVRLSSKEEQEIGNEHHHQQHHDQQQQQQHHHDQHHDQQQQQHQHSPSKQLFDKYLDEISDDDDNITKNNKLSGTKNLNDNYDDDFEA